MTVRATLDDGGLNGPVKFNWGDGTPDTTVSAAPWRASHLYATAGAKTITATTVQTPSLSDTDSATVPYTG